MTEISQNPVSIAATAMGVFRSEMEAIDKIGGKVGRRAALLTRVILTAMGISGVYLVYLVYIMTSDLETMVGKFENMHNHMGTMSSEMKQITQSVTHMGTNVQGMPSIARDMLAMSGSVDGMLTSIGQIDLTIDGMNVSVYQMGQGTTEMTYRFSNLSTVVGRMNRNVNTMLGPFNMLPR